MGYVLASDYPKELAYQNRMIKEMDDIKKGLNKKRIPLNWDIAEGHRLMSLNSFFFFFFS